MDNLSHFLVLLTLHNTNVINAPITDLKRNKIFRRPYVRAKILLPLPLLASAVSSREKNASTSSPSLSRTKQERLRACRKYNCLADSQRKHRHIEGLRVRYKPLISLNKRHHLIANHRGVAIGINYEHSLWEQ